jgi:hypothetical protein
MSVARWANSSPEREAVQGRCRAQRGGGVVLRRKVPIAQASTKRGVLARRSPSQFVRPLRLARFAREPPPLNRMAIQGRSFVLLAIEARRGSCARSKSIECPTRAGPTPPRDCEAVRGRCRAQRGGGVVRRRKVPIAQASTKRGVLARRSPPEVVRPLRLARCAREPPPPRRFAPPGRSCARRANELPRASDRALGELLP